MYPEGSTPLRNQPKNLDERLSNERAWTDAAASANLEGAELIEWMSLRSTHRFMAFQGKQLFVWRQNNGVPEIVRGLEVEDLELHPEAGFAATLFDHEDRMFTVTHVPARVDEGIYLWMPYYNDVQFVKRQETNEFAMYFSMMCRMPRNPSLKSEGALHISERKSLLALWPDISLKGYV